MKQWTDFFDALTGQKLAEQDRRKLTEQVLPEDLTGQVYLNAKREHDMRMETRAVFQAQLDAATEELEAVRRGEAATLAACHETPRRQRRHIFDLGGIGDLTPQPVPGRYQVTPKTLEYRRKHVKPVAARVAYLETQIGILDQQIAELRKIGEAATLGDVGLVTWLSQRWASQLLIGADLSQLAPVQAARLVNYRAAFTDAAGVPLPPEALGADGNPKPLPTLAAARAAGAVTI